VRGQLLASKLVRRGSQDGEPFGVVRIVQLLQLSIVLLGETSCRSHVGNERDAVGQLTEREGVTTKGG
jgi:hypothetical protein